MTTALRSPLLLLVTTLLLAVFSSSTLTVGAADRRASDIRSTKHNFSNSSVSGTDNREVKARSEANNGTDEVCVFCHTPHGASTNPGLPLWNRSDSAASYTMYDSSSLNASASISSAPTEQSKLCLSCHDGTVAIGAVGNAPGSGSGSTFDAGLGAGIKIRMQDSSGTSIGDMADVPNLSNGGIDSNSGFTRHLGVDLSNDHPISFPYTTALATADGELRDPASASHIASRSPGVAPIYPLTGDNLQCTTCHDPHVTGIDAPTGTTAPTASNSKFLRGPRFQMSVPSGVSFQQGVFNETSGNATSGDIVCLACHDRELDTQAWAKSAHADPTVANETYTDTAADLREFPRGIAVWQASCLNCHDTHSVAGSRRLLREGTDGTLNVDGAKSGGSAALEETCYQCHTGGADGPSILSLDANNSGDGGTSVVPNIETEFQKNVRMPIATGDQQSSTQAGGSSTEEHDITDADFSESFANLGGDSLGGLGDHRWRHAECTDCHNPHRVIRNSRFLADADGDDTRRTHETGANAVSYGPDDGREGNIASGVLRGAWGIEPTAAPPTDTFLNTNLSYRIVKGAPPANADSKLSNTYLTREYQLCFKCHSRYGFGSTAPSLGDHSGGTAAGTCNNDENTANSSNCMTEYTDVMAEFASVNATYPATSGTDQGEGDNTGTNICAASATNGNESLTLNCAPNGSFDLGNNGFNHRSWHPVMFPTGRNRAERSMAATGAINLKAPFVDNIGTQTMQCSDCHGGEDSYTAGSGANLSEVQGPHGSDTKFLLKYNDVSKPLGDAWESSGAGAGGGGFGTELAAGGYGFCGNCHQPRDGSSGYNGQHQPDGNMGGGTCMTCHIAVPHGWKNKAFLVNLLCVGTEGTNGPSSLGGSGECRDSGGYDGTSTYNPRTYRPYYNNARLRVEVWRRSGNWGTQASCSSDKAMEDGCPKTN